MTNSQIWARLADVGIRIVRDHEIPINGKILPLPYLVALPKLTVIGSDNGAVSISRTDWQLALLTAERNDALNQRVLSALAGCGRVSMEHFPELNPYQTTFKFTTFDV